MVTVHFYGGIDGINEILVVPAFLDVRLSATPFCFQHLFLILKAPWYSGQTYGVRTEFMLLFGRSASIVTAQLASLHQVNSILID